MSKLVNELIELQRISILNIKKLACLAIEYYDKNQTVAEDLYKLSRQEEKKSRNIKSEIKHLINDDRLFDFLIEENTKALSDARYMQRIYVGLKRELQNDKGYSMEQEAL